MRPTGIRLLESLKAKETEPNRTRLICDKPERIDFAVAQLEKAALIANDIETHPFKKSSKSAAVDKFAMTVCAYACDSGDFIFPLQNSKSPSSGAPYYIEEIINAIKHINNLPAPHVGHNFTYDVQWYIRYGMPIRNWGYDTMVMFWSIWPDMPKSLGFVSSIFLDDHEYWKQGRTDDDWLAFLNYAGKDVWATLRLCKIFINFFTQTKEEEPGIADYRRNFLHAMLRCYAAVGMNAYGSYIDETEMAAIGVSLAADAEKALAHLKYLVADPKFNPRSPAQMKDLIYNILGSSPKNTKGRPVKDISKAATGQVVQRLVKQEGLVQKRVMQAVEQANVPMKQISNIVNMPQLPVSETRRRFYTSFNGVGTISTRFASSASAFGHGSNAQNIRKKYRRILRADPGYFLLEIDFSGADAVYVAFEAEEERLIYIFENKLDAHAMTSSLLFDNWTYEAIVEGHKADLPEITHPIYGIRQVGKKVGHGCNYLMASMTLLMTATVPTIIAAAQANGYAEAGTWSLKRLAEYCAELERRYRSGYPRLQRNAWYQDIAREIEAHARVKTIYGYAYNFPAGPLDDANLRLAAAIYGQASTAGRTNAALYELAFGVKTNHFRDGNVSDAHEPALPIAHDTFGIHIVRQTHDSLTFHCRADHPQLSEGLRRIFHVMRRPFLCKGREFALGIDAEVSRNWAHNTEKVTNEMEILNWVQENKNFLLEI